MAGQVIFVSGGNRGVGFQLVKRYASIKENTVIATTRNIENSPELSTLAKESGNIKVVTVDVGSQESIDALEKELPKVIASGIDIFISNAAIAETYATILDTPRSEYDRHYKINVLGSIFLSKILYHTY